MYIFEVCDLVFLLVALLVFAFVGWPCLRMSVIILLSRKVRCTFAEGPDAMPPEDCSDAAYQLMETLEDMGFHLLGVKLEWRPLQRGKELAFASERDRCFASVHRFTGAAPHYYFYTPFTDGAVVLTSDLGVDALRTDTFWHSGLPNTSPRRVFDLHLRHVDAMIEDGHEPYEVLDRAARIEATYAYYANPGSAALQGRFLKRFLLLGGFSISLVVLALLLLAWRIWQ
jgi:hypothetical protein